MTIDKCKLKLIANSVVESSNVVSVIHSSPQFDFAIDRNSMSAMSGRHKFDSNFKIFEFASVNGKSVHKYYQGKKSVFGR
jgi:hypothetical protein